MVSEAPVFFHAVATRNAGVLSRDLSRSNDLALVRCILDERRKGGRKTVRESVPQLIGGRKV